MDLNAVLSSTDGLKEPECPDPSQNQPGEQGEMSGGSILAELDALPGYLYRQHLPKFYKPEKALKDVCKLFTIIYIYI